TIIIISFFFQAVDGIRDFHVTVVQTCALPIWGGDVRCQSVSVRLGGSVDWHRLRAGAGIDAQWRQSRLGAFAGGPAAPRYPAQCAADHPWSRGSYRRR